MDSEGLRHVLLCRVILGKPELVSFGSEQSHPSSEQYDSGIDDLSSPTRYIVWSTLMNTHVLPEYVISFRAPCGLRGNQIVLSRSCFCIDLVRLTLSVLLTGPLICENLYAKVLLRTLEKPTSPRVTLSTLFSKLSKILLPSDANLLPKYYEDYKVSATSTLSIFELFSFKFCFCPPLMLK